VRDQDAPADAETVLPAGAPHCVRRCDLGSSCNPGRRAPRPLHEERQRLEDRLIHAAEDLADDIDGDIVRDFTLLNTLATVPALQREDWSTFYTNAKAALQGKAYVIVLDTSLRQLVNTYVPFGEQPELTGDPETARRVIASKQPVVSDLFISRVTNRAVFSLNIPVMNNGDVACCRCGAAWLFARAMEGPMRSASEAAAALSREEQIKA
jgi:hypothetical protein